MPYAAEPTQVGFKVTDILMITIWIKMNFSPEKYCRYRDVGTICMQYLVLTDISQEICNCPSSSY